MNLLQNGTSSSQLSPQSFKNSQQNATFQDSGAGLQKSQSVYNLQSTNNALRVTGVQDQSTLGASTVPTTYKQEQTNTLPFGITAVAVLGVLAVYFLIRFRRLSTQEER